MITLAQLLSMLEGKLKNPVGGTAGQILKTDGIGGVYWDGGELTIAASKVRVGGKDYTIRTGSTGADGYITIAPDKIFLGTDPVSLDLGGKKILQIFKGTSSIYSAEPAEFYVYNESYVNGITWRGNSLPRPQYTSYGSFSLANANNANGYMLLNIEGAGSTYGHNSHVITTNPVKVPNKATKMHVYCRAENNNTVRTQFGLLPSNASNSYSTAKGGLLSESFAVSGTTWRDCVLDLTDAVKGATDLYPIINAQGTADSSRKMRVAKVWFD